MKQIAAILKEIGLPDDDIKTITELPADQQETFDVKPFAEKISGSYQTKLLADPKTYEGITIDKLPEATRKVIETGQYERYVNELADVATKELGLKEGEDFTADDKRKAKHFTKIIATKFAGKGATAEGVKKIQDDLLAAIQEKNDLDTTWKTKYDTDVKAEGLKGMAKLERLAALQRVANIPDLKVKPGLISDSLMARMNAKYAIKLDPETMEWDLKQKASPTLDVIHEGKVLLFDAALAIVAAEEGVIGEKKKEEDVKKGEVTVEGEGVTVAKYILDKAGVKKA